MTQPFVPLIKDIVWQAGEISLDLIADSRFSFKKDRSIVTAADEAVSKLVHEKLQALLKTGEHILIEEEDPKKADYLNQKLLSKTPYIWAVDPIDGSRNYSNRMPNFAVSVGVLKDLKPWLGAVYFPALKELFFCDGEKSYFIQNAFSPEEKSTPIVPVEKDITGQSIFLLIDNFFKDFTWDFKDCRVMNQSCATIDFCWPSIGRGVGSIFKCSLWDFAGSWPIALDAGLKIRSLEGGRAMEKLDSNDYKTDIPWRLKEHYLLATEKNYAILKGKIKSKK